MQAHIQESDTIDFDCFNCHVQCTCQCGKKNYKEEYRGRSRSCLSEKLTPRIRARQVERTSRSFLTFFHESRQIGKGERLAVSLCGFVRALAVNQQQEWPRNRTEIEAGDTLWRRDILFSIKNSNRTIDSIFYQHFYHFSPQIFENWRYGEKKNSTRPSQYQLKFKKWSKCQWGRTTLDGYRCKSGAIFTRKTISL